MQSNRTKQMTSPGKISLHAGIGKELFLPGQIIRLEAKSNYTKIFFTNNYSLTVSRVLKDFLPLLEPAGFVRTHRSHLVNRQYILQVCGNGTIIRMNDSSTAGISKRKKAAVLRALQVFTTP